MTVLSSKTSAEVRGLMADMDRKIDEMHQEFFRYRHKEIHQIPDWQRLERDLLFLSRGKNLGAEANMRLDGILYKFQNRKRIWLQWADERHGRV